MLRSSFPGAAKSHRRLNVMVHDTKRNEYGYGKQILLVLILVAGAEDDTEPPARRVVAKQRRLKCRWRNRRDGYKGWSYRNANQRGVFYGSTKKILF